MEFTMGKKIYLAVIYIITLICVTIGVLGNNFNIAPFNAMTFGSNGKKVEYTKKFDSVSNIDIDLAVADIEIVKGTEYSVTYKGREKLNPSIEMEGSTIKISQDYKMTITRLRDVDSKLIVTVPDNDSSCNLVLNANVGDISIDDVNLNKITADVDMGNFEVNNAVFKDGEFDVNMGNAEVNNCTFNNINASVDMGNAEVKIKGSKEYNLNLSVDLGTIGVYGTNYSGSYNNNASTSNKISIDVDMGNISVIR